MDDARQEAVDRFYHTRGTPCCAGCDWWRHISSLVGECTKSAPVSAAERLAMLGLSSCFPSSGAGHVVTPRDHACGEFQDSFDWSSLPLPYRRRIGAALSAGGSHE